MSDRNRWIFCFLLELREPVEAAFREAMHSVLAERGDERQKLEAYEAALKVAVERTGACLRRMAEEGR